jgi:hypothetical protein
MTDHHDDFDAEGDSDPALDGIECAFVVDPVPASNDVVDTQPALSLFDRLFFDDSIASRFEGTSEQLALRVHDGVGFVHLVGPDGWLTGLEGRWVGVTLRDGELTWRALGEEPTAHDDVVATIRDTFAGLVTEGSDDGADPETGDDHQSAFTTREVLETAIASAPDVWRAASPVPVARALDAAGLGVHDFWVGDRSVDWHAFDQRQLRNRLVMIHDLDDTRTEAAVEILQALADGSRDGVAQAVEGLEELVVARAVRDELWARLDDGHTAGINALVEMAEADPAALNAGAAWVAACKLMDDAHPDRALAVLEPPLKALAQSSTTDDPDGADGEPMLTEDHGPMVQDLALLKADADELAEAHALFHVVEALLGDDGDDDDPYWFRGAFFEATCDAAELLSRSHPRNGPCPCGSGRKYKACHRGQALLSQSDRAGWIYQRVKEFAHRELSDMAVDAVKTTLGRNVFAPGHRLREHGTELIRTWMRSPIVSDAVFYGHGGVATYVQQRRAVLSDADHRILDAWLQAPLRLVAITDTGDRSIKVTDRLSGETITLDHLEASTRAERGATMLGRPLPTGPTHRSFHGFLAIEGNDIEAVSEALAAGDEAEARAVAGRRFLSRFEERLNGRRDSADLVLPSHQ